MTLLEYLPYVGAIMLQMFGYEHIILIWLKKGFKLGLFYYYDMFVKYIDENI